MNDTHPARKRVPLQSHLEQRQELIGIAASEFQTDISGVSRRKARRVARDLARKRCQNELQQAFDAEQPVLLEALMGIGKSHGAIKLANLLEEPAAIFGGRGHKGQYRQYQNWCDKYGLKWYLLPSFLIDCETARGDHSEQAQQEVIDWYHRGLSPSDIHTWGDPPCVATGRCNYELRRDFDPQNFDVLIGDYSHAYVSKYIESRTGIFDEFPGPRFVTGFTEPQEAISEFLTDSCLPFDTFTQLLAERNGQKGKRAIDRLEAHYDIFEPRAREVINSPTGNKHARTPLLVYALLQMNDLGNGWEAALLRDWSVAHDTNSNELFMLKHPDIEKAKQIIGLDGTPSWSQWNIAFSWKNSSAEIFDHRRVLTDEERQKYIRNVLELKIIRTTDNIYPYSSGTYVNAKRDLAYLQALKNRYGTKPTLFTSKAAEETYKQAGVKKHVAKTEHFGNIRGSNDYSTIRLSAIIGSPNNGDKYVQMWSAFSGIGTNRKGKGKQLSFTGIGDEFLHQMREQEVLQTIMRIGRDANGAIVYVHTGAIPEWVPIAHGPSSCEISEWTDTQKDVIRAIADIRTGTTTEICNHSTVSCSEQYATRILHRLVELGYVSKEDTGSGYKWSDVSVSEIEIPVDVQFTGPCQRLPN